MIEFECDRCERVISVEDGRAGEKMDCPHCGDVNRVPVSGAGTVAARREEEPETDRAAAAGLPPDSGPERHVLSVRRSLFRARPLTCIVLAAAPIALVIGLRAASSSISGNALLMTGGIAAAVCWGGLLLWWINVSLTASLKITNKRTVELRGLFSRSTNEVLHDHVRNIQVNQSLRDRLFRVGAIGISSSGQEGIEIEIRDMPNPKKIREIIDAYRPL